MIFGGLEMPNYSINALCWRFRALRGPKITIPTPLVGPTEVARAVSNSGTGHTMPCAGIWYGVLAPRGSSSARASNLLHAGSDRFVTLLSQLLMQLASILPLDKVLSSS